MSDEEKSEQEIKKMVSRSKRTFHNDDVFFSALSKGRTVKAAAKLAGYSEASVYKYRDEDEAFYRRWKFAKTALVELADEEFIRRGVHGFLEPVFYKGEEVGTTRKFSDKLLIEWARKIDPTGYGRKQNQEPENHDEHHDETVTAESVADAMIKLRNKL